MRSENLHRGAVLVCLAGILTIRFAGKRLLPEVKPVRC